MKHVWLYQDLSESKIFSRRTNSNNENEIYLKLPEVEVSKSTKKFISKKIKFRVEMVANEIP